MRRHLLPFALFQFAVTVLFAQPGTLDNTFAGNGKKQTPGRAAAVLVQPADQKIVVAGGNQIVRYTSTGPLDTQFGSGGIVTLNFGSARVVINAIALQPDGMIICAGMYNTGSSMLLFITRLRSNGVMDGNFNAIGFNTLSNYNQATGSEPDGATAVALQSDGKIVVCGEYYPPGGVDNKRGPFSIGVARFTTTGLLDNTFGSGGQVITNPGSLKNVPTGIAITPADKIIISGYRKDWLLDQTRHSDSVLVFQYTKDGVLDAANFGTGGIARYSVGNNDYCRANAITLQTDGKLLLAGYYAAAGVHNNFLILRLKTNGTLDNSFAGNGKLGVPFTDADYASGIGIEPGTGAIVAAGVTAPNTPSAKFAICRVLAANGVLDNGFGAGGQVVIPWTASAPVYTVGNLAIQANGRIVVTGNATTDQFNAPSYMATIRLLSSGFNSTAINDSALVTRAAAGFTGNNAPGGIKFYPNPTAGQLQITGLPADQPVILTVTDLAGNTVLQQRSGQSDVLLDLSRLAPASYILSITGANGRQSLPFIKVSR
jgi:uncharacterized delta-60 repeat protein